MDTTKYRNEFATLEEFDVTPVVQGTAISKQEPKTRCILLQEMLEDTATGSNQ